MKLREQLGTDGDESQILFIGREQFVRDATRQGQPHKLVPSRVERNPQRLTEEIA